MSKETKSDEAAGTAEGTQPAAKISKDACTWAMFCHLAGLGGLLVWIVPVIGGIICPLILWQLKKGDDPFIDEQGKESVNFQISMLLYWIIAWPLCFACIGIVLVPLIPIADVVLVLIASIKAGNGRAYRYPLTIRFIK